MDRVLLVRYGEISLKGLNKNYFINTLITNIKHSLKDFSDANISKIQGRIMIRGYAEINEAFICERVKKVFGIVYISKAIEIEKDISLIRNVAAQLMKDKPACSFKVEARRSDKSFFMKSPKIAADVGEAVLAGNDKLRVDVHNPNITVSVEIREKAYIIYEDIQGESGLPLGTSGRGGVLLSGGIDSPVAAYLCAKRGMKVEGIHFHSYPYTSLNAKEKVVDITKKLSLYNNGFKLAVISLTEIQEEIIKNCRDSYLTVILRRFMLRCAERYAAQNGLQALITGESLGQVASQTIESISCTNSAIDLPVLRPLITFDKNEIIKHAEHIDTYSLSILPYEDCCTVFVPKHPQIKPVLEKVLAEEAKLDCERLINNAMATLEIIKN